MRVANACGELCVVESPPRMEAPNVYDFGPVKEGIGPQNHRLQTLEKNQKSEGGAKTRSDRIVLAIC